jgi:hypothetical protein
MFSDNFARAQAPRNLDIGVVLGGAFGAIGKHWRAFAIYSVLLVILPDVVVPYFTPVTRPGANLAELWANLGLVLLITTPSSFLFVPVFTTLIGWTTWADSVRVSAEPRAALSAVARQLPWLLVVNLVVALATGAAMMLLLVPGIMVALAFQVATIACVVEGLSLEAALNRSRFLTRGQRWRLLGLLLIVLVITFGLQIVLGLVRMMLGIGVAGTSPIVVGAQALGYGVSAVIGAATTASAYVELVEVKGGGNVAQTAEVFA